MHIRLLLIAPVLATFSIAAAAQTVVRIGVLNELSSVYSDAAGLGSVAAAKMAVADSGIEAKGFKVEVLSADHQNKPDVGSTISRRWFDVDGVEDEGVAHRRPRLWARKREVRWSEAPPHVFARGQKAQRVEGSLGLLQGGEHGTGERSVPPSGPSKLLLAKLNSTGS